METIVSIALLSIMFLAVTTVFGLGKRMMNMSVDRSNEFRSAVFELNKKGKDATDIVTDFDSTATLGFDIIAGSTTKEAEFSYQPKVYMDDAYDLVIEIVD